MMMQRLIWKDVVTIKPLVWAAVIVIVAANLLLYVLWRGHDVTDAAFVGWSIALWIIAPNFVAFGAPALLIGTEEESGTIRWLRTLPIGWQQIADAKLCVAFGGIVVVWGFSSLVLWLQSLGWHSNPDIGDRGLVSAAGIVVTFYCSMMLLLLGLATAYLIRSPLLALLALAPTFLIALVFVINLVRWWGWMDSFNMPGLVLFVAVTLTSLWIIQRLLAWRRLRSRDRISASAAVEYLVSTSHYRPRTLPVGSKPSQVVSLLWQQLRQTGPLCLVLLVASTFLGTIFAISYADQRPPGLIRIAVDLSPVVTLLSASWFGAIVFYGDSMHRRCSFFADRGISPTRVWWTRMAPPAIACALLIGSEVVLLSTIDSETRDLFLRPLASFTVLITVLFAFGQLVSQWSEKPLLAFLAAPAYACVSLVPVIYLLERYNANITVTVLTVPVLLLATWRLTGRWLDGEINRGYTARVLGYTAIAVLLPCLWIGLPHWLRASAHMISYAIQTGVMP